MQPTSLRDDRILAKELAILFDSSVSALANLVVGAVVAWTLRDAFPPAVLFGWVSATALVAAGRIALKVWFDRTAQKCSRCWAGRFTAGAFASGALWGVLCLALALWGKTDDFLLLTLVSAGLTAGALATVISHFPAYLAYATPIAGSMALVSLAHPDRTIAVNGLLILVYFAVVVAAARNGSRAVNRSIALQVDLEETSRSLEKTRGERDTARKEKWSTLAQLSHELRTPLNAIMGFSEAMTGEYFGPLGSPRYKEYAGNVHAGGKHLTRLVEELLELSRSESGQLELREAPVELDIVLASCIDIMQAEADGAQITMTRRLARGLPLIRADKTKLRQMVLNLLSNAIKFTPPGGEVTASAFPAPGGGVAVVVQDTGIGMSEDEIAVALAPFGRVSSSVNNSTPGMGLGLPMVERFAQLHGAELAIASEPGFGTRCTLWFPAERCLGETAAPECTNTFAA